MYEAATGGVGGGGYPSMVSLTTDVGTCPARGRSRKAR